MHVTNPPPLPSSGSPPSAPRTSRLFRSEVLAERRSRWLGTVLLAPPVSAWLLTSLSLASAAAVIALLTFGEFTRRARVVGWLTPEGGLVRVFAPQPSVIVQLHVREGETVSAGARLVTLSTELRSEVLGALGDEILVRLRSRRDSVALGIERQADLFAQQAEALRGTLAWLDAELAQVELAIGLEKERLVLAEKSVLRQRQLRAADLVTIQRLDTTEELRLAQAVRMQGLERERTALRRQHGEAAAEFRELPLRRELLQAQASREIATLEQEIAEVESRREIVVTAPHPGIVALVQAEAGSGVTTTTPLVAILPAGAALEAQLFTPSSAIGFVRRGQRVLLRYDAFPYQKFGQHPGEVADISRAAISPSELPANLAGLGHLRTAAEPLYRVTVRPGAQDIAAYGERLPLQPGMQIEADVLIERRRLYEWVLDPLKTLSRSWQ